MKSISALLMVAALSSAAFAHEAVKVEISVSKEGVVAVAGQPLALDALAQHLATIAKKETQPEVVITYAKDAPQKVTTLVLDACRQSGLNKIRLQMAEPTSDGVAHR